MTPDALTKSEKYVYVKRRMFASPTMHTFELNLMIGPNDVVRYDVSYIFIFVGSNAPVVGFRYFNTKYIIALSNQ